MSWVIEIGKALAICAVTVLVLTIPHFVGYGNSKSIGIEGLFRLTGLRLALVGTLNLVIGLVLTRLDLVLDATGRTHLTFH